jgi:hypothetical protein
VGTVLGGILDVAGIGAAFLTNLDEVELAMDEGLAQLITVAERVVDHGREDLFIVEGASSDGKGKTAKDWLPVLRQAGALSVAPGSKEQADWTIAGRYLAGKVNRPVPIATTRGAYSAVLKCTEGRSNKRCYHLELTPQERPAGSTPPPGSPLHQSDIDALLSVPPPQSSPPPAGEVAPTRSAGNGLAWSLDG